MSVTILGIESSCDDTSSSVIRDGVMLSNVIASQAVHEAYGGVVPELASRAHQQNIIPVVSEAIRRAGIDKSELDAVAFTRGPGLMGSLLVGTSFAKGFSMALDIPMIEVNHLQAHVLAHFIKETPDDNHAPSFPFLCLLVSGGNSQIIKVNAYNEMEVIGQTIDDAAGEAFDKCAKVMGLGYPGGPVVNRLANQGNPKAFSFSKPHIPGYDYSFSGLKTSFLYTLRDRLQEDPAFIEKNKEKAEKKQKKRGERAERINAMAQTNTKSLSASARKQASSMSEKEREEKVAKAKASADQAKAGSLAAKANMVKKFNENK